MRNILLSVAVAAVAVASVSAYAGGAAVMPVQNNSFAYVEVNGGWANRHNNYKVDGATPYVDHQYATYWTKLHHDNNAFTLGGDVGYQFMHNLAIELGGSWLQNAKGDFSTIKPFPLYTGTATEKSWLGYLALKMSVPVADQFSLFAKAGVGYQHQSISATDSDGNSSKDKDLFGPGFKNSAWVPVFAVGANYDINQSLVAGVQWMHYGDYKKVKDNGDTYSFTAKDLVTVSLGYKFTM